MTQGPVTHVDTTIEQLAALHEQHDLSTSRMQRLANSLTGTLSRPVSLSVIVSLVVVWMVGNYIAKALGSTALEDFPFPDLAFFATIAALFVALLILTTQRHQDELADKRARLTLQIAVLSEKKIAKVIQLLEEQRRDNPLLATRTDMEAEEMSTTVDPQSSLQRLESSDQDRSPAEG